MEERIRWREQGKSQIGGEEKRNGRLVGAAETSKELAEWRRLPQRNLSILSLLNRKEWPRCHRESSWQVRQSRQSKEPGRERESQGEREPHLGEKEKDQNESKQRKEWNPP